MGPPTKRVEEAKTRQRKVYRTENGAEPFLDWMRSIRRLREVFSKALIRLDRAEKGNFGDRESVGEGVIELKIDFGPGYRVYFGIDGDEIILLWGGTKKTQQDDIEMAQGFWRDYNA